MLAPGWLRRSRAADGRCDPRLPRGPVLDGHPLAADGDVERVAILADPGGPVLDGGGHALHPVPDVAILADPGGPVLGADPTGNSTVKRRVAILADPGGPVLALRSGHHGSKTATVAILADPGGPVLAPNGGWKPSSGWGCDPRRPRRAGAGGRGRGQPAGHLPGCDPRRPRRAGAGSVSQVQCHLERGLRSSPNPEGRCWPSAKK